MIKKKNLKLILAGLSVVFAVVLQGALLQPAYAVDAKQCVKDGKVPLAIKINGQDCIARDQIIVTWAKAIIQFLAAGVGIAVVGGIITGGIFYATARDNASQTQKAVMIITNSIVGLILFIMMFAIINFIIPGGILG
jgi:uncharacterized membrane protein